MTSAETLPQASLLDALARLDARLLRMVDTASRLHGREPGVDPFRGLYLSEADFFESLNKTESDPIDGEITSQPLAGGTYFLRLGSLYSLSSLELDVLLIALAPDIDPRYERIFAYLQDDVSRRRPGIDFILSTLCDSAAQKLEHHRIFRASGSLIRHRLIRFPDDETFTVARREVRVDPRIVAFLLGEDELDSKLARFVNLIKPAATDESARRRQPVDSNLAKLAGAPGDRCTPLSIYFRGPDEDAKRSAAIALAQHLNQAVLLADLSKVSRSGNVFEESLLDLAHEARLREAITFIEGLEPLADELRDAALRTLCDLPGVTIVSGRRDWQPGTSPVRGVVTVPFDAPRWPERRTLWQAVLTERGVYCDGQTLDTLAECFHFTGTQIADAAETAYNLAVYRGESPVVAHVFESARAGSGHDLRSMTRKVKPAHGWDDIVLPDDAMEQLREICRRVTRRHQVLGRWGFERKLSSGKGVSALFHGHTGTGKTMAAEVIAGALGLDLYKIDLAGVVSKYIGETEKNLDRIFAAAETANAILFFDEADALFGKRSEVRDSHDRYANLEISYLLQKMEQYEGVAILATNLRQNLDDAFLRRLTFTVQFPFPDECGRRNIWERIWPAETPVSPDVDASFLAGRFLLSGGNIRNIALGAAYLAIEDQGVVTLEHVLRAVRAEFQKMGKSLSAAELAPPVTEGAAA